MALVSHRVGSVRGSILLQTGFVAELCDLLEEATEPGG